MVAVGHRSTATMLAMEREQAGMSAMERQQETERIMQPSDSGSAQTLVRLSEVERHAETRSSEITMLHVKYILSNLSKMNCY